MTGQELVTIFLTNGTSTSAGNGPGPLTLPAGEAAALVGRKVAVYGGQPPGTATHLPGPAGPEISAGLSDHADAALRQHLPEPERAVPDPQAAARVSRGLGTDGRGAGLPD